MNTLFGKAAGPCPARVPSGRWNLQAANFTLNPLTSYFIPSTIRLVILTRSGCQFAGRGTRVAWPLLFAKLVAAKIFAIRQVDYTPSLRLLFPPDYLRRPPGPATPILIRHPSFASVSTSLEDTADVALEE